MVEIEHETAARAADACRILGSQQDKAAQECQEAHDNGHSYNENSMVWDYSVMAQTFRESAERWRTTASEIEDAIEEEEPCED